MSIGNMKISHQMKFPMLNIKSRITLELKPNDGVEVCSFLMDFGDAKYAQSSRAERNDEQRRAATHRKDLF